MMANKVSSLKRFLYVIIGWNGFGFINGDYHHLVNHNFNATSYARPLNFAGNDLVYLSELPLEQLLHVQKSINELKQMNFLDFQEERDRKDDSMENRMISEGQIFDTKLRKSALALTDEKKIDRKHGGWMEDPWDSKPSKVQTFFQISITALAFLSFAGYLLCMIVQAIKSKGTGTMYLYPNSMSLTSGANAMTNTGSVGLIRKRRPVGRRRRNIFMSTTDSRNASRTTSLLSDELLASPDPAEMYNVMIQCAEDYTKLYFVQ